MFGMFKNSAINISISDLDPCIFYLTTSVEVKNSRLLVTQLANTINHWITELSNERVEIKSIHDHFQNLKNQVLREKSLENHKDPDFCSYYILMSFFFCLMHADNDAAKIAAIKILDMCESKCELKFQNIIKDLHKPLRQLFRN